MLIKLPRKDRLCEEFVVSLSLYHTSFFLKPHPKLYPQFRNANPENNDTCFGAYLYSAGSQHGNLHHLSVTMSRVTYFILRAHTATGVSHSQLRKNPGEIWEQNVGEWNGRVEISKEEIPGSKRSMCGYSRRRRLIRR